MFIIYYQWIVFQVLFLSSNAKILPIKHLLGGSVSIFIGDFQGAATTSGFVCSSDEENGREESRPGRR